MRTHSVRSLAVGLLAMLLLAANCGSDTGAVDQDATATDPRSNLTTDVAMTSQGAFEGQQFLYGDSERAQLAMLHLPAGEVPAAGYPVVILVHGGFWSEPWDYTLMSPLVDDLVARGYATWNIEFRRLGGYGGYPETFDDVAAAIDALAVAAQQYPVDLDRTALVGHSSGGHLALWALDRPDAVVQPVGAVGLAAIVDLTAFPQAQRLLGGSIETVPDRYAAAAPSLDPNRVALVQGASDGIVPLSTLAPAELAGVPIVVVPDADHFDVIDPRHLAWNEAVILIDNFLELA